MTIYDIAKLAGVSKTTVSRVINNDQNVKIETKNRVLDIIKQNNYVPNKSARMLNSSSKKTLLVIMTRLDSAAEYETVRGIIEASKEKYELLIFESQFDIEKTKEIVQNNMYVDGITIFAIGRQDYAFMDEINIATVYIGQKIYNKNSVYYQNKEAVELVLDTATAVKEIKKIIYIGVSKDDPTTGLIRHAACEVYCMNHNIELETIESNFNAESTFTIFHGHNLDDIDMIVCATDRIALGVYKELLIQNKTQIILSGIGNVYSVNFVIDNFLTVDLNYLHSGYEVVEIIEANLLCSKKQEINIINKLEEI